MSLAVDLLHQYTRLLDINGEDAFQAIHLTPESSEELKNFVKEADIVTAKYSHRFNEYDFFFKLDGYEFYVFPNIIK